MFAADRDLVLMGHRRVDGSVRHLLHLGESRLDPKSKATGFAAGIGGALAGAWLGFIAITGLFAIVMSIVGAVVGANLLLQFASTPAHRW